MVTLNPTSFTEIIRLHRHITRGLKGALVVTSAQEQEGASTLAYTLAVRSAETNQKTLFIDLNMKNTWITNELGLLRQEWKLPERRANDTFKDIIEPVETQKNLFILPTPLDEASIRYLSKAASAAKFLDKLATIYDHVIIDTTPITAHNRGNIDPVLLATAAERCVLTTMTGVTPRERVRQAVDQLENAGANLIGVVANTYKNPSRRQVLLHFARTFQRIAPGLHNWLRHRIMNADLG